MHTPRRRSVWRRRAADAALLLLLLAPVASCTVVLWQDNRSHVRTAIEAAPSLRAFRLADAPSAFVMQLSPDAVRTLRQHAPELPATLEWLRVEEEGCAELLEAACKPDAEFPVRVVLFRDAPQERAFWSFCPPEALMSKLFQDHDWRGAYEGAACDVTSLPAAPAALGAPLAAVSLEYATRADDGTPVLVRVALTPIAVALDCVFVAFLAAGAAVALVVSPFAWLASELG